MVRLDNRVHAVQPQLTFAYVIEVNPDTDASAIDSLSSHLLM